MAGLGMRKYKVGEVEQVSKQNNNPHEEWVQASVCDAMEQSFRDQLTIDQAMIDDLQQAASNYVETILELLALVDEHNESNPEAKVFIPQPIDNCIRQMDQANKPG